MATSDAREMEEHLRWVMVQELIVGVTALEPDTENYDTACEWAAGTLQHHTYLDLNIQQVRTTHQETLGKLRAHARFGQADRLAALYDNLVKRDRDYEVRDTSCEKENPRGSSSVVCCASLYWPSVLARLCWPVYVLGVGPPMLARQCRPVCVDPLCVATLLDLLGVALLRRSVACPTC